MGVFCRRSLAQHLDAHDIIDTAKRGFAFFEERFGVPYAFGKYDQLFVPEFNAGAMENAGCVTFHEDLLFRSKVTDAAYEQRSNTILHELAHMWFGNLVTMRWWDDLWLNESFAEWAAHYANVNATRFGDAWATFCNLRKAWAYRQDQLPSTHPIAADMVDLDAVRVNFDGITYAKGASALRQLVAWVGEDGFLDGVRSYFQAHAWGNTELSDLLHELTRASGRDLSSWTHEWLETAGVNTLVPEVEFDGDLLASLTIVQTPPTTPEGLEPILRSHRIAVGLYDDIDGALARVERVELDVTGERTVVDAVGGMKAPALIVLNDDDLTFAKTRLDPRSADTAARRIGDLASPLTRALLWGASWDMTRDAELATRDYVSLVIAGLPSESSIGVVQQSLRQARSAVDQYADPAWRGTGVAMLADATASWMRSAEAGSDRQLAFVRGFAANAEAPEHLAVVAALLDGTHTLEGLDVDTELRWALLHRLCASGTRGDDAIAAELERDNTAAGRRHAAAARAALPTPEAKEAAWAAVVDDDALPNAILGATIGGLMQPDQVDLLRPYVARYFEAAATVWERRTNETAQDILLGCYPVYVVEDATVAAADAFLTTADVPAPVRRLVSEGRDATARALRARAADAAARPA
jgi:aminopeptidase N